MNQYLEITMDSTLIPKEFDLHLIFDYYTIVNRKKQKKSILRRVYSYSTIMHLLNWLNENFAKRSKYYDNNNFLNVALADKEALFQKPISIFLYSQN